MLIGNSGENKKKQDPEGFTLQKFPALDSIYGGVTTMLVKSFQTALIGKI